MSDPVARPDFRTFKPRRRQLTPARAELFERLAPVWCLDETGGRLDPIEVFGRSAPLVLDIGIGFGDSLTTTAAAEPDVDLIGADVHTPGDRLDVGADRVDAVLERAARARRRAGVRCPGWPPARWPASGSTSPTRGRRTANAIAG